jgi:hypothetical protein
MTNTPIKALSAIRVSIINDEGSLEATITLEEFLRLQKVSTSTSTPMPHAENSILNSRYQTLTISSTKCKIGENNSSKMTAVDLFRSDGSSYPHKPI